MSKQRAVFTLLSLDLILPALIISKESCGARPGLLRLFHPGVSVHYASRNLWQSRSDATQECSEIKP